MSKGLTEKLIMIVKKTENDTENDTENEIENDTEKQHRKSLRTH